LTTKRPFGSLAQVFTAVAVVGVGTSLATFEVLSVTRKDSPAFTFFGVLTESFSFGVPEGGVSAVKVAVTDRASLIVTEQVPVPEHPEPDQPVKVEPAAAVAVKVTWVPRLNWAWQLAPQSIRAGVEVTVPSPDLVTESWYAVGSLLAAWMMPLGPLKRCQTTVVAPLGAIATWGS